MTAPPRPGRRPGNGTISATERRVSDVVEIVRRSGGPEKDPVRFSQVYPQLAPPSGSKNPEIWQRTSAWRALESARRRGLLLRTAEGYRATDSPSYAFHGARANLDRVLQEGVSHLRFPPSSPSDRLGFSLFSGAISKSLAGVLGKWTRAIDLRLIERMHQLEVDENTVRLAFPEDPADRLVELVSAFVAGYLTPEKEEAEERLGVAEGKTFSLQTQRPWLLPAQLERFYEARAKAGTGKTDHEEAARMMAVYSGVEAALRPTHSRLLKGLSTEWAEWAEWEAGEGLRARPLERQSPGAPPDPARRRSSNK